MMVVRIEWFDAQHQNGWDEPEAATHADSTWGLINESFGYLLYDAEDRVVIAQTRNLDDSMIADRLIVPRPCIVKIETIRDG